VPTARADQRPRRRICETGWLCLRLESSHRRQVSWSCSPALARLEHGWPPPERAGAYGVFAPTDAGHLQPTTSTGLTSPSDINGAEQRRTALTVGGTGRRRRERPDAPPERTYKAIIMNVVALAERPPTCVSSCLEIESRHPAADLSR
jgi:hypothetical protein